MIDFILNLLFPKFCLECGKYGEYVCNECFLEIRNDFGGKINVSDEFLEQVFFCLRYKKGGIVQKLIRQFKYKYSKELAKFFGEIFRKRIIHWGLKADIIVPVPTSRSRLKERGFNQALLIGQEICSSKVVDCLFREDMHIAQAKLNRSGRLKNLKGMIKVKKDFSEKKTDKIRGKRALLVDDVATTLSTLKECARTLRRVGVSSVCGVVIGRGEC